MYYIWYFHTLIFARKASCSCKGAWCVLFHFIDGFDFDFKLIHAECRSSLLNEASTRRKWQFVGKAECHWHNTPECLFSSDCDGGPGVATLKSPNDLTASWRSSRWQEELWPLAVRRGEAAASVSKRGTLRWIPLKSSTTGSVHYLLQ